MAATETLVDDTPICNDCKALLRLSRADSNYPPLCHICLNFLPDLRAVTVPTLLSLVDSTYSSSTPSGSASRDLRDNLRLSPADLAVTLSPVIFMTCCVAVNGDLDRASSLFDRIKGSAKDIIMDALSSSSSFPPSSAAVSSVIDEPDDDRPSKRRKALPQISGTLKAHVGLFSPHSVYPPSFDLSPSQPAVKSMLKSQKKNRLRTNSPNVVGTTGGSVIDNLEGRLFAEYGVDVDSAKYAESVIKLEDLKMKLKVIPLSSFLSTLSSFLSEKYFNQIKYDMVILPPSTDTGDSLRASVLTVLSPSSSSQLPPNFGAKTTYFVDIQSHYPTATFSKVPLAPTPDPAIYCAPSPLPSCIVPGKLCVLRGDSPRYKSTGHVIVGRVVSVSPSPSDPATMFVTLSYYHDPHPSRENIGPSSAKWAIFDDSSPPPLVIPTFAVSRTPIYIKGCYTKLSRLTAQTPFFVPNPEGRGVVRKGETSVEEEICSRLVSSEVLKICTHNNFRNREFGRIKFHASGREDMDVRMLSISGSGRPFVVEITDSSKVPNSDELRNIESFICGGSSAGSSEDYGDGGGGVGVMGLRLVGRNDFGGLQRETEDKVKHYGCLCWSAVSHSAEELRFLLDSTSSTTIVQSTPVRVLHRRAQMKRTREILYRRTEWINDHWFRLWIATSAGAYVKEFVTGDFGKTVPSVSDMMGCQCDILQLDCVGIQVGEK